MDHMDYQFALIYEHCDQIDAGNKLLQGKTEEYKNAVMRLSTFWGGGAQAQAEALGLQIQTQGANTVESGEQYAAKTRVAVGEVEAQEHMTEQTFAT